MKIKFHVSLIWLMLIAVALGIFVGHFASVSLVRVTVTFNAFFSSLLAFIVPLLVLALVTAAISETTSGAGKMLVWTIVLAYLSTILSGLFGYSVGSFVFPDMVASGKTTENPVKEEVVAMFQPYFKLSFPPVMDTMSALVLAFMLGIGVVKFKLETIGKLVSELRNVVMMVISGMVIPLLPVYIFGVFMKMTKTGEMELILSVYWKICVMILLLLAILLVIQYLIAGWIARKNPFKMMYNMFPALLTALASSSSAATLPITLNCAKKMGASDNVVNFVIPMCANVHLSGASLRIVALAVATMLMFDVPFNFLTMFGFILIFSITVLAAPGIPGGVIFAAVGLLQAMLGFSEPMIAIMISLNVALDSLGTAVNVTGDGALMMIIDKIMKRN